MATGKLPEDIMQTDADAGDTTKSFSTLRNTPQLVNPVLLDADETITDVVSDTLNLGPAKAAQINALVDREEALSRGDIESLMPPVQNLVNTVRLEVGFQGAGELHLQMPVLDPHGTRTQVTLRMDDEDADKLKKTGLQTDLKSWEESIGKLTKIINEPPRPGSEEELRGLSAEISQKAYSTVFSLLPDIITTLQKSGKAPLFNRGPLWSGRQTRELVEPMEVQFNGQRSKVYCIEVKGVGTIYVVQLLEKNIFVNSKAPKNFIALAGFNNEARPGFQLTYFGPTKSPEEVVYAANGVLYDESISPKQRRNVALITHKLTAALVEKL